MKESHLVQLCKVTASQNPDEYELAISGTVHNVQNQSPKVKEEGIGPTMGSSIDGVRDKCPYLKRSNFFVSTKLPACSL